MDPNSPLHDIDEAYCHVLTESFRNYKYGYARTTMAVYFSTTPVPESNAYPTAVNNLDGMKLLKDGCCMVMLDERHRSHFVEMLSDIYGVEWAADPLRIC